MKYSNITITTLIEQSKYTGCRATLLVTFNNLAGPLTYIAYNFTYYSLRRETTNMHMYLSVSYIYYTHVPKINGFLTIKVVSVLRHLPRPRAYPACRSLTLQLDHSSDGGHLEHQKFIHCW